MNTSKRKNVLATMVGLFATAGGVGSALAQGDEAATAQGRIDEIIVTATKRGEGTSLQDTALSISALTGATIDKRNLVGMEDYLPSIPGVSMQDRGGSRNSIVIRGIASDPQDESSNVGVYFGETPVTNLGSGGAGDHSGSVDIKLIDVERIEVLRGPQGTFYGSSSMGGAVRVIPETPDLDQLSGKLAANYSHTDGLGKDNNTVQGVVNLPLINGKFAVRGVAYQFNNSGYIENVAESQPNAVSANAVAKGAVAKDRGDVGNNETTGYRLSALWRPSDQLKVSLVYLNQDSKQDGKAEVDTDLIGQFQQARLQTGTLGHNNERSTSGIALTNLVFEYDLSWATMVASSSWVDYEADDDLDWSFHPLHGQDPWSVLNSISNDVFSQEIRFSSNLDGAIQFVSGVYYEDNKEINTQKIPWSGSSILDPGIDLVPATFSVDSEQKAFFGELNYDITEKLTATVGIRHFDFDRGDHWDIDFLGVNISDEKFNTSADGQTYKVSLAYNANEDTLFYSQWSEGFRLGKGLSKSNAAFCDADNDGLLDDLGIQAPTEVDPDWTENFELGVKASLANNRVTVNAAFYLIDWEGIPLAINLPSCASTAILNAGFAKSEGVELEIHASPTNNLLLNINASYGEAYLTKDIPNLDPIFGGSGDNLPGSADFNLSVGAEYTFMLFNSSAFIRGDYVYVGEYYHNLTETGPASGDYGLVNLKAGLEIKHADIEIFVKNLTNADDFTWVETLWHGAAGTNRAYRLKPRTIGINLKYRF